MDGKSAAEALAGGFGLEGADHDVVSRCEVCVGDRVADHGGATGEKEKGAKRMHCSKKYWFLS